MLPEPAAAQVPPPAPTQVQVQASAAGNVSATVPVVWLGFRFRQDYKVVARRARDQAGDLATAVEESVHGIRVLKAFGRGQDALDDFVRQADELRATEVAKARTQSRVTFALGAIPEAVLAVSLAVGVPLAAADRLCPLPRPVAQLAEAG